MNEFLIIRAFIKTICNRLCNSAQKHPTHLIIIPIYKVTYMKCTAVYAVLGSKLFPKRIIMTLWTPLNTLPMSPHALSRF